MYTTMAYSTKVNVGLKNAQERLTLAQERLTLVRETQAIYNSMFADDRALMPLVIKLASLNTDNTVILLEIELDEALENLRLVEREHFVTGDDGDDGDADDADDVEGFDVDGYDVEGYDVEGFNVHGYDVDGYDVDGYDVDGYDVDGYNVDGYNVDGYDVGGYDIDSNNVYGIPAFTNDFYEYIE